MNNENEIDTREQMDGQKTETHVNIFVTIFFQTIHAASQTLAATLFEATLAFIFQFHTLTIISCCVPTDTIYLRFGEKAYNIRHNRIVHHLSK